VYKPLSVILHWIWCVYQDLLHLNISPKTIPDLERFSSFIAHFLRASSAAWDDHSYAQTVLANSYILGDVIQWKAPCDGIKTPETRKTSPAGFSGRNSK